MASRLVLRERRGSERGPDRGGEVVPLGSGSGGYAVAQCNLGVCYANGRGVSKDMEEAVKWLRLAAEQGSGVVQAILKEVEREEIIR